MNKIKISKYTTKIAMFLLSIDILLVMILAFGSEILDSKNNNRLNEGEKFDEINISEFRIKTVFDKKVKNRAIRKIDYKVFIGEIDKQIENGYYDVKAYIHDNEYIVISVNKLWKDFDERLYEEEYVEEIVESIKNILDINVHINEIYDYILSGYLKAKNNYDVNNKENILDLGEYVIKGKILEKEFVMSIYKK